LYVGHGFFRGREAASSLLVGVLMGKRTQILFPCKCRSVLGKRNHILFPCECFDVLFLRSLVCSAMIFGQRLLHVCVRMLSLAIIIMGMLLGHGMSFVLGARAGGIFLCLNITCAHFSFSLLKGEIVGNRSCGGMKAARCWDWPP
jgi:hypothetical protein